MGFSINSDAFSSNGMIPKKYSGQGENISPPLAWSGEPDGTKSFALIVDDPDVPLGTFVHWVIYDLPSTVHRLPENVERSEAPLDGARQGKNSFFKIGYVGPMPPTQKPHRYFFKLFALDATPQLEAGADKRDLLKAMEGHVMGQAQLMGVYQKQ
ncbi:MAG: YbhB/YbcL family Raf kinase inhibitor-like protein [Limisphaerales bacterium]